MSLLASPAIRMGISISIATGLFGVSFGALSVTSGLNVWQTMALSLLLFSGGSQFAFIGVVAGGGSGIAAMSALLLASAMKHFRDPAFYRQVVPGYLCRDDDAAPGAAPSRPLALLSR